MLQIMLIWDDSFPIWEFACLNGIGDCRKHLGLGKMLLCVTWLILGQESIPFTVTYEDELYSFLRRLRRRGGTAALQDLGKHVSDGERGKSRRGNRRQGESAQVQLLTLQVLLGMILAPAQTKLQQM